MSVTATLLVALLCAGLGRPAAIINQLFRQRKVSAHLHDLHDTVYMTKAQRNILSNQTQLK